MRTLAIGVLVICGLVAVSCSSGPAPPKVGSPEFYWAAAKETYVAGDYMRTAEHLERLAKDDNAFTSRAQPWHLVLTAGMARAYMEMADQFEYGAKANRRDPTPFRRSMNEYRTYANRLALQFADTFEKFEKMNQDQEVVLEFGFPQGTAMQNPLLAKIGNGEMPQPALLGDALRQQLQTGVVLATCRAVGAPDDTAKGQELFKGGPVKVPREVFVLEMANQLHEFSVLYAPTKLNQPQRQEFLLNHAMEALKSVPDSKQVKALVGKLEKGLKSLKK
jgi:hypothetical protein